MPICSDREGTDGPVVVEDNEAIDKPAKNKHKNTCPHGCNKNDTTVPCQCVVVGQLVILGYNGNIPSGESTRRKCKYTVLLRPKANGVKLNKSYIIKSSNYDRHTDSNRNHHSIVYTLPRYQTGIVEYIYDENTDLFQIGRSSEPPIDFVVMDTYPGNDNAPVNDRPSQSTISRFACRILIERKNPKNARIYAAGFDNSKNIFLGEKATQWEENGDKIDGLTTNGVLIMHPRGPFCGGDSKCGSWREISIGGDVYSLRESRSAQQKGSVVKDEDNVLKDGTLIDLCGATLLWRSAEGLEKSPTKTDLEASVDKINAGKPQCPVGFNTLVIPRRPVTNDDGELAEKQALVYLNCGHVQGYHMWRLEKDTETRECPLCRVSGPINKLYMGIEAAFYVDKEPPTFAFNPCGHMASEKTVKYWEKVQIPHGTNGYIAICPFCATPLEGSPGYVKLIFQDHIDNNQRDDNVN